MGSAVPYICSSDQGVYLFFNPKVYFHVNDLSPQPNKPYIYAMYSSPHCYLKYVLEENPPLELKQDDFFPVSADAHSASVGHFYSCPALKLLMREGLIYLQMAKQLQVLARLGDHSQIFEDLMWIVGVFQDHTILTGGSDDHIKSHYILKMYQNIQRSTKILKKAFNKLRESPDKILYYRCSFNESRCIETINKEVYLHLYNPLAWSVRVPVRIPVNDTGPTYVVYNPKGEIIDSAVVQIPDFVKRRRISRMDHEVVFIANLPSLGFKSYCLQVSSVNYSVRKARETKTRRLPSLLIKNIKHTKSKSKYIARQINPQELNMLNDIYDETDYDEYLNHNKAFGNEVNNDNYDEFIQPVLRNNSGRFEKKQWPIDDNTFFYDDERQSVVGSKKLNATIESANVSNSNNENLQSTNNTSNDRELKETINTSNFQNHNSSENKKLYNATETPYSSRRNYIVKDNDVDLNITDSNVNNASNNATDNDSYDEYYDDLTLTTTVSSVTNATTIREEILKTNQKDNNLADWCAAKNCTDSNVTSSTEPRKNTRYYYQYLPDNDTYNFENKSKDVDLTEKEKRLNLKKYTIVRNNDSNSQRDSKENILVVVDDIADTIQTNNTKKFIADHVVLQNNTEDEENNSDSNWNEQPTGMHTVIPLEVTKITDFYSKNITVTPVPLNTIVNFTTTFNKNNKTLQDTVRDVNKDNEIPSSVNKSTKTPKSDDEDFLSISDGQTYRPISKKVLSSIEKETRRDGIIQKVDIKSESEESSYPITDNYGKKFVTLSSEDKILLDAKLKDFAALSDDQQDNSVVRFVFTEKSVEAESDSRQSQTEIPIKSAEMDYEIRPTLPTVSLKPANNYTNEAKFRKKIGLMKYFPDDSFKTVKYENVDLTANVSRKYGSENEIDQGEIRRVSNISEFDDYEIDITGNKQPGGTVSIPARTPSPTPIVSDLIPERSPERAGPYSSDERTLGSAGKDSSPERTIVSDARGFVPVRTFGSADRDSSKALGRGFISETLPKLTTAPATRTPAPFYTPVKTIVKTRPAAVVAKDFMLENPTRTRKPTHKSPNKEVDEVLKPKGTRRRIVKAKHKPMFIENEYIKVNVDPRTHKVSGIQLSNGVTMSLDIQFYYYASDDPMMMNRSKQPPGAYIFRPIEPTPVPLLEFMATKIIKTSVVQEIHCEYATWASLVVRLYKKSAVIEVTWAIGPIPDFDAIGKEVFIRYQTDLASDGVFHTDANGRQTVKRLRNVKPMYRSGNQDVIGSNIYPVTSKVYIEDAGRTLRFAVFPDRAQAATSLYDGVIDLLIARRIHTDDNNFRGQTVNDTAWHRGTHHLYLSKSTFFPNKVFEKKFAKELLLKPQTFVMDSTFYRNIEDWMVFKNEMSFIEKKLPVGVHLLTLEEWNEGTLLIRLENYLEKSDTRTGSPKKVFLKDLFTNMIIERAEETMLAGNIWKNEYNSLRWKKKGKFLRSFNEFYGENKKIKYAPEEDYDFEQVDIEKGIILKPQQIRTFVCWYSPAEYETKK